MRGMAQSLNLAKSTNDNGFGMLKTFLAYKLMEKGKYLVIIDKGNLLQMEFYTSSEV